MNELATYVELVQLATTWALVGLIWQVQLVQYPSFELVGADEFRRYHDAHMRRITFVVGPLMLTEVVTALLFLFFRSEGTPLWVAWIGLSAVLGTWISTAAIQVPSHRRLERAFDPDECRRLVRTNWIRTALWSARGILLLAFLT